MAAEKSFRAALLAGLLWAGPGAASSPEAPALTLARAIELAVAGDPELAAAAALERSAAAGVAEARAAGRPRLELAAELGRTNDPVRVFGGLLAQERFTAESFDLEFLNRPDPLTHATTRLDLRFPLYTGGRLAAGRDTAAGQLAAAGADRESFRQQVVRQVIAAYTRDWLAGTAIATLEAAARAAEENRRLAADLFASGLVVESDLLQARLRVAELEEALVAARAAAAMRRAELSSAMGLKADTPWRLDAAMPEVPGAAEADEARLVAELAAARRRPDLSAAMARERAAQGFLALRRAEGRPEIGAAASFEAAGEQPFDPSGEHWSVGIAARWLLADGGARRARERRAEAEADAARARRAALERRVELEVRQAHEEARASARRRDLAAEAIGLAERSLEIVRDRYREGLSPWVELLAAEAALAAAANRQLEARGSLLLAQAQLALSTGSL